MIYSYTFKTISDQRGTRLPIEALKEVPFDIKRTYYLFNLNKKPRGFHAHHKLQQMMICLNGSCKIKLDNGAEDPIEVFLDSPSQGIFIDKMIWHEMYEFSSNCIIAVLSSDYYDEKDYIRNYQDFGTLVKKL